MKYDKVAILIKKASLEFDKVANPILQEYDLSAAQYKILKYLFMHKQDAVRQVDMERYYSLTHPTAIGLLDQLEKKGFVIRTVNPEDARSRIISLTDKALAQQKELEDIGNELENRLTAALSKEERKELVGLLQKMLTVFQG